MLALSIPWRDASSPRSSALRFTPFSFEAGGQSGAVWAPDGKAVAFGARQNAAEPLQIYVRYLDSPVATPITHLAASAIPIDWTSAGRIVFRSTQAPGGLWSISPVGGEPQPLYAIETDREANSASISRDGSALAWMHRGEDGAFDVWTASPPGAMPKAYEPAPFTTRTVVAQPWVKFSPDGKQILLIWNPAAGGPEAWLMPYPASAAHPPHRVLEQIPMSAGGNPTFSWMPDSRHVVLATAPVGGVPDQLYLADTLSGTFAVLSGGTRPQGFPAVSPDGSKLVSREFFGDFDVVSVDVATAAVTPLIATQRSEEMPAWASKEAALVYVTNRNGAPEIWLHKTDQLDRPLVTARDFPPDTTDAFEGPILSPDAARVIYTRLERNGPGRAWISAVAGGSPVRLVKTSAERDWPGSWSPDGNWFAYAHFQGGRRSLYKVKTTGQAVPDALQGVIAGDAVPVWSPTGEWILYFDSDRGMKLISPDGKMTRYLSAAGLVACAFSADGQTIYGIRQIAAGLELFSTGVNGGHEKTIGSLSAEYLPAASANPSLRLSLAPDGKSLTYSTVKVTSDLWLIEGLDAAIPAK
jgi:eukaryotic-like serine/threonine-protein kinase